MKVNLSGSETIDVPPQTLWDAVIDPATLQKAVPGCRDMRAVGAADYIMTLDLKVAAVGGSFEGKIALSDMSPPHSCTINLSGEGSLGTGTGTAKVGVKIAKGEKEVVLPQISLVEVLTEVVMSVHEPETKWKSLRRSSLLMPARLVLL